MKPFRILALDPSLTAFGIAVVERNDLEWRWVHVGCVVTKPDNRSKHVYQADRDGARVDEIANALRSVIEQRSPSVIVSEAPAGSQHAASAKALALAYGVVRTTSIWSGLPILTVQAHEAKRAATGSKSASKDEIIEAMTRRFAWTPAGSKPQREAIADALAVACAAIDSPMLRMVAA